MVETRSLPCADHHACGGALRHVFALAFVRRSTHQQRKHRANVALGPPISYRDAFTTPARSAAGSFPSADERTRHVARPEYNQLSMKDREIAKLAREIRARRVDRILDRHRSRK